MVASPPRREARSVLRALAGSALLGAFALLAEGDAVPSRADELPLPLEVSGCEAIVAPGLCEVSAARPSLRVWVDAPPSGRVTFATDVDAAVSSTPEEAPRGSRFAVAVPAGASVLLVRAAVGGIPRAATLRLALEGAPPVLVRARELRAAGDEAAAEAVLRSALDTLPPADAGRALGLLGRLELSAGHADTAEGLLARAIERDRAGGRVSDAVDDAFARAYVLTMQDRFAEVRGVLGAVEDLLPAYPDGRARAIYYRAVLDGETGNVRAALSGARAAREAAARLGLDRLRRDAIGLEALSLSAEGRGDIALARLTELRDREKGAISPCEEGELLSNLGWIALHARSPSASLNPHLDDAVSALQQAVQVGQTTCPQPASRRDALLNLAEATLARGDARGARVVLDDVEAVGGGAPPRTRLEVLDTRARIELAGGSTERALSLFRAEGTLASDVASVEARWRAALGAGEALEKARAIEAAAKEYARAEGVLDEGVALVPSIGGRDTYLADHGASARGAVDALLRLGYPAEALAAARRARRRGIVAVEMRARIAALAGADRRRWDEAMQDYARERDAIVAEATADWSLARVTRDSAAARRVERRARLLGKLDAALGLVESRTPLALPLAAPPPGTLLLAYVPVGDGWVAFAQDEQGVEVERLATLDPDSPADTLGKRLLAPFDAKIERARVVHVLAEGAIARVDVHALPWRGEPLIAHAAVTYPLDVPRPSAEAPPSPPVAVVVANPGRNLASAPVEADDATSVLGETYAVHRLDGRSADLTRVSRELEAATFFHFTGHGRFGEERAWDSALLLGAGELRVDDVLTLARVPRYVVLAGCETALASLDAPAEGTGLAQAFVIAGSEAVVGSVRVLDDAQATLEVRALYDALRLDPAREIDLGAALARAQRAVRGEIVDWAAFRVVTP